MGMSQHSPKFFYPNTIKVYPELTGNMCVKMERESILASCGVSVWS